MTTKPKKSPPVDAKESESSDEAVKTKEIEYPEAPTADGMESFDLGIEQPHSNKKIKSQTAILIIIIIVMTFIGLVVLST